MKYCPRCELTKPYSEFYKCRTRYDKVKAYCKQCEKKEQAGKSKYFAKYRRDRYKIDTKFREDIKKRNKAWKTQIKALAHAKVNQKIKHNTLKRLDCIICGKPNAHAHHEDYSLPYEIIWLCPSHHKLHHNQLSTKRL